MTSLPEEIILATRNPHKVKELQAMLNPLGIKVYSVSDFPDLPEVIEDGTTFKENAQKKAVEIAKQTGLAALADDSGLVVDALNGEPGVYSARYAGEDADDQANNFKLMHNLVGIPHENRIAHFISVIAFAKPDGMVTTFEGTCDGYILEEPRGSCGFGYDPLFYLPDWHKSMAELSPSEKNKISHRGKAYQKFVAWLEKGE